MHILADHQSASQRNSLVVLQLRGWPEVEANVGLAQARPNNIYDGMGSSSAHAYYVTKWRTTYTEYKSTR